MTRTIFTQSHACLHLYSTHIHTHTQNLFFMRQYGYTSSTLTHVASHTITHSQTHRTGLRVGSERSGDLSPLPPPSYCKEVGHSDHRHAQLHTGAPATLRQLWLSALSISTGLPPGLIQAPPHPCQLGLLRESRSQTGGPMEVHCAKPGRLTCFLFHYTEFLCFQKVHQ